MIIEVGAGGPIIITHPNMPRQPRKAPRVQKKKKSALSKVKKWWNYFIVKLMI